ncbi:diguanylate cyclase [Nitrobacter sp. Nb-311A]|uniref:GGDEF domain-containing protein n=1 Tax=Nitrobacter sp. Nb-311A TaxID=314253 RepID=UPI0000687A73|nr:GGDEF domain-containing protein [Nitrobacter sp. Nb-311A]EAQ36324.1 diguanylate cyclase [Nitrobacter sp. Nb-311A]
MLSVPTLWVVFIVNFLALGLVWTYVMRSYPTLAAAPYWAAASFVAAFFAAISILRGYVDLELPLVIGGGGVIFTICLCTMGIRRFYERPVSWQTTFITVGMTVAGVSFFQYVRDDMPMRIFIYSAAQATPIAMTLKLVLSRGEDHISSAARLAGIVGVLIICITMIRSVCAVFEIGGGISFVNFNGLQAALTLALVFLSMVWNFAFLLMAIERLRNEVVDLALVDDLTGVANRRQLLGRLEERCAMSQRSGESFVILVADLDGFKQINDTHGHAAGDACLRHFTLMTQMQLRPGDLLARTGGDEFCVLLPSTTLGEGVEIARRVLNTCREDAAGCTGADIPIAASIGLAQWTREIGACSERLLAAADRALYAAKNEGKNRFAFCGDIAPPLAPELPPQQIPSNQKA